MLKFFNIIKNRVISVVFLKYDRKFYTVERNGIEKYKGREDIIVNRDCNFYYAISHVSDAN